MTPYRPLPSLPPAYLGPQGSRSAGGPRRRDSARGRRRQARRAVLRRVLLSVALVAVVAATFASPASARGHRGAHVDRQAITSIADGSRVGVSWLVRSHRGAYAVLRTRGVPRGDAVTIWAVVFNDPAACEGPCDAADLGNPAAQAASVLFDGAVIRRGAAWFRGRVSPEALTAPDRAEIHLVVRTHGPVIPGLVEEMTSTLNGGCPPNVCANLQMAVHAP